MTIKLLLFVFLLVSQNKIVRGQLNEFSSWVEVHVDISGTNFVDKNSLKKSGDSVTFWEKKNLVERDKGGTLSTRNKVTINCKRQEFILRHIMAFDDKDNMGRLLSNFDPKNRASWTKINPESPGWFTFMNVCNYDTTHASANWTFVSSSEDKVDFFIDRNSIQKQGDSITFWYLVNFNQRQEKGVLSVKIQGTINCRKRDHIERYYYSYDDINNKGSMLESYKVETTWMPIIPDSSYARLMNFVCK